MVTLLFAETNSTQEQNLSDEFHDEFSQYNDRYSTKYASHERSFYIAFLRVSLSGDRQFRSTEPPAPTEGINLKIKSSSMANNINVGYVYKFFRFSLSYMRSKFEKANSYTEYLHYYGADIEYFPILYEDKKLRIRSFIGASTGVIKSDVRKIIIIGENEYRKKQKNSYMGYNLGLNVTYKKGFYYEVGLRYRTSVIIGSKTTSVSLTSWQKYIALGFIF